MSGSGGRLPRDVLRLCWFDRTTRTMPCRAMCGETRNTGASGRISTAATTCSGLKPSFSLGGDITRRQLWFCTGGDSLCNFGATLLMFYFLFFCDEASWPKERGRAGRSWGVLLQSGWLGAERCCLVCLSGVVPVSGDWPRSERYNSSLV